MIIALADLLEAEGRSLRRGIVRLQHGVGLAILSILSILLAAGGAGLLLWTLYQSMVAALGQGAGAFITGLAALFGAGVLSWLANVTAR